MRIARCGTVVVAATTFAMVARAEQPPPAKANARQAAPQSDPAFAAVTDDPKLPRVLLIGDSISIGYTVPSRKELAGKANVHRIPTNGGPTTRGLEQLDRWLGDSKWDVIHFNWGLHDLKHVDDKGDTVAPGEGHRQVSPEEYEANLRKLVARLKNSGARLVWCSTTPVPAGAAGRTPGDEVAYNAIAARVMEQERIPTDDLYSFARARLDKIQRPANVHFTPEGSAELAKQVAASIAAALAK
ncbi:MAG: SGNH/GDSL hydrolase family protein [Planctomycetia bacterium]|nr:SGNH/GDSL hydrolase family protein [Planctomycetia bacterium]